MFAHSLIGLHRAQRSPSPAWLSLKVRVRRSSLDIRLAEGETAVDPALARRAEQLGDRRTRLRLSRRIAAILRAAPEPAPVLTSAIPIAHAAVANAQPALRQLHVALRSPEPVQVRGVAQVCVLLRDGASPLFAPADPDALYRAVREALLCMCAPAPATVELVPRGRAF